MPKPAFHSLRVQVLLWTILPLLIVLFTFSLSGAGSHQVSVRQLVVEENTNLIGAASAAIEARLGLYSLQFEDLATHNILGTTPAGIRVLPPLDVWRLDPAGTPLDGEAAPSWVGRGIAAAQADGAGTAGSGVAPWLGLDGAEQRILWVQALPAQEEWQVGSIHSEALGLANLFANSGPNAPVIALVDNHGQVVGANTTAQGPAGVLVGGAAAGLVPADLQALLADVWQGAGGVQFVESDGVESVVAYAPLPGTPWALVISRPIGDLIAPFFRFEKVLPLILMAAALVSFLTLSFGLNLVVRPVKTLIDYATRIGQGDFWAAARSMSAVQELEELRQALHAMAQLLQEERAGLQNYRRAATNAQEEERARLARDLHDDTVQTLIALDHKTQLVQRSFDKHPERTREQLAELRKLTAQATQDLRRLTYGLRPLGLDEIGLDSALSQLAQEGRVLYRCQGDLRRMPPDRELAFYRIAQESLANTRRHAHATCVRMMLVFGPTTVTLGIGDDGVGFTPPPKLSDLALDGHFGLMGIAERAGLIGGRLFCASAPGQGSTIIVQAPSEANVLALDDAAIARVRAWITAREG